ncbi:unnamed protein product [Chrysoparadoxa australica]
MRTHSLPLWLCALIALISIANAFYASVPPVTMGMGSKLRSVASRINIAKRIGKKNPVRHAGSCEELDELMTSGVPLGGISVFGSSHETLAQRQTPHPVLQVLSARAAAGSKPGQRADGLKVGLAVEGGGMRGCTSAGMVAALCDLGLMDCMDAVYGSSAGSLVSAYALANQPGMPRQVIHSDFPGLLTLLLEAELACRVRLGCSIYYDTLTGEGNHFIDTRYIWRQLGLGLLGAAVTGRAGLKDLWKDRMGNPVLKLDYLLKDVVEKIRPLDWSRFWATQTHQPLHVIASGVQSGKSVALSAKGGHFSSLEELTACMRASMLLPGITGPLVNLANVPEPLVDSQLYEPIPFYTAVADGCTHILVLRSRPDGANVVGKPKLAEIALWRRFFKRKSRHPEAYKYMKAGGHKKHYAEAVLTLNAAAAQEASDDGPYLMAVSLKDGEEIGRLEQRREAILDGVRKGYEAGYDLLRGAAEGGGGAADGQAAGLTAFPPSILDSDEDPILI